MCGFNSRWALSEGKALGLQPRAVPSTVVPGGFRGPLVPLWGSQPAGSGARLESGYGGHSVVGSSPTASAFRRALPRGGRSRPPPRCSDRPCVWRTGPSSNRKTPAWHVGDPGATPGGSTCGRVVVDDPVVQRRQHPAYNRKTMVRVHPGSFGLAGRFLSPGTPPDTGVKRVWHRSSGRARRMPGSCLSSWCSPECTLPCHGGGRGFKSHRGR